MTAKVAKRICRFMVYIKMQFIIYYFEIYVKKIYAFGEFFKNKL